MMILPDTSGRWETFAHCPVSKTLKVHIAFDGEVTTEAIQKAMKILELSLDWTRKEKEFGFSEPLSVDGVRIEAAPPTSDGVDNVITPKIPT